MSAQTTDGSKEVVTLMLLVGVLSIAMGVASILGGAPTPGVFFVVFGLISLGAMFATKSGMADDLGADLDQIMSLGGLGAAGAVGLGWLGMAAVALSKARTGGMEGHPDLHFWWGFIATFLTIAGIVALTGGFLHFRQQRDW